MNAYFRGLLATAALAGLVGVGTSKAQAGVEIQYSVDNGATRTTLASSASGTTAFVPSGTFGGLTLSVLSATSNSPGTPTLAEMLSATLSIENNTSSVQSITFYFGDTDFMAPTAPPALQLLSAIGGSVTVGGINNALSFISCVDAGNGQNTCPIGSVVTAADSPDITAPGSYNATDFATITSLAPPYSISQQLTLTLDPGSQINFSDTTFVEPVPEPDSIALFGVGLLGMLSLSVGLARRRS